MENSFHLLGASATGGRDGVSVSSSYSDDSTVELGLGLSLGGGSVSKPSRPAPWAQYARILTAKDFPSSVYVSSPSSSSSSSSSLPKSNAPIAGTKRAAGSVSPPRNGTSPVVGWPPIRAYRMNSLANQAKSPAAYECDSGIQKNENGHIMVDTAEEIIGKNSNVSKDNQILKTSQFVKVNIDGIPIGRKVDLSAHFCYATLSQKLEDMFCKPIKTIGSSLEEQKTTIEDERSSKLLDRSWEFVLTYEDKDGDWMLVGDVPWRMFVSSVRRLKIMRAPKDNGVAPRLQERTGRQKTRPT